MNTTQKIEGGMGLKGVWKFTLKDIITGKERTFTYENLIPTVGRAAIADHLTNPTPSPSSLRINYTALGTGANVPANGDTELQTETFRKAVASETNADNIAYVTAFYTAPEVSGTFLEAGLFINGTITPDSGTLFSRVAINITKTITETLTIDYTITLTSS